MSGARPVGLAPAPRRTIPGHGAARGGPRSRRYLFQGGRAPRLIAETTRGLDKGNPIVVYCWDYL